MKALIGVFSLGMLVSNGTVKAEASSVFDKQVIMDWLEENYPDNPCCPNLEMNLAQSGMWVSQTGCECTQPISLTNVNVNGECIAFQCQCGKASVNVYAEGKAGVAYKELAPHNFENGICTVCGKEGDMYVSKTMSLIRNIGQVRNTKKCKKLVEEARSAYDALTDDQKAKVTNFDTLVKAENYFIENAGVPFEKEKLEAPKNPGWERNGNIGFSSVPEANGYYRLEAYKDDQVVTSTLWHLGDYNGMVLMPYSDWIVEGGAYKFRICSAAEYDPENYEDSEWSEFSKVFNYVRPQEALGTTVAKWDEKEIGKFSFVGVGNAGTYRYELRLDGEYAGGGSFATFEDDPVGKIYTGDCSHYMVKEGNYTIVVRALSNDIEKLAHGEWGEASAVFSTAQIGDCIKNAITDVKANSPSAESALTAIKEMNQKQLAIAMQTDAEVVAQLKEIEAQYMKDTNVNVAINVDAAVTDKVDADKISVVGAVANGAGRNVEFNIAAPTKQEVLDSKMYAKSVQLDIKLKADEEIHNLTIPTTITMPVPENIALDMLELIHYKQNGTFEKVNFRANEDNTITFTVTEFSNFVFAQKALQVKVSEVFNDVKESEWWFSSIQFVYDRKMMAGTGAGFNPSGSITREQFVQVLYNIEEKPSVEGLENKYTDVKNAWYKAAVLWAKKNDIANGKPDGSFGVGENITREALVMMLYKYAKIIDYKTTYEKGKIAQFADGSKVSSWATEAMEWAVSNGVVKGKGNGEDLSKYKLDPQGSATRAECAAIMKNFFE